MKSWLVVSVVVAVAMLGITRARSNEPVKIPAATGDSLRGKEPGDVRDDNGLKMKLVWCPAGFFKMEQLDTVELLLPAPRANKPDTEDADETSSAPEGATTTYRVTRTADVKVSLTRGFWLGKFEVTQAEWKLVMKTEPWKGQEYVSEIDGQSLPATYLNWDDALEFCRKLTAQERAAGRLPADWEYTLPTEAQWERACRARTTGDFSFGNDASQIGDYAWWGGFDNGNAATEQYAHPVGLKKANPWGLYDMHGNVWEWCRDWYSDKLPGGRDPEVLAGGPDRVLRSGGWNDPPRICRSASRLPYHPTSRRKNIGLRVALTGVFPAKPAESGAETRGKTNPDVTIQTCWDSDRLDLGRVGVRPHPSRLCTDAARRPEMLNWADGRASVRLIPPRVADEWGIILTK